MACVCRLKNLYLRGKLLVHILRENNLVFELTLSKIGNNNRGANPEKAAH